MKEGIATAAGKNKADLVLKNANIVNVFSNEIEFGDIAIKGSEIVGIGHYEGHEEVDLNGKYVCPGFLDGHIHLESSMISPSEFEKAVIVHGTTTIVADPHEIANVAGAQGIDYLLDATKDLNLDVYFVIPSCVPATDLDESGAVLKADDIQKYYENDRVLGLAEVMNSYGIINGDGDLVRKLLDARKHKKVIDGHAPFLSGNDLNAYVYAGVKSDHECSDLEEAFEKLRRGQWIMIRQGTAAKNLKALIPLGKTEAYERCMFVTDDKHPGDLIRKGHMDGIIREAINGGIDPIRAIRMASTHVARYFKLEDRGAVAPGYRADLVVFEDLETIKIHKVYKNGRLVVGETTKIISHQYERVYNSFHMNPIEEKDLLIVPKGKKQRVIQLQANELLTEERIVEWKAYEGYAPGVQIDQDIVKIAVLERHSSTGHIGLGFLGGYGLKNGAVASSIAHDSHNLIVVGTNDKDMVLAGNQVLKNKGGLAVVVDGKIIGDLALPIAGLMSNETAESVDKNLSHLKRNLEKLGIGKDIDAFMTLAFVSLPVIPQLRLNTYGLVDVEKQCIVDVTF